MTAMPSVHLEPKQRAEESLGAIGVSAGENRNTATVLMANHSYPITTIKEVFEKQVPGKFRVLCHIKDFTPRATKPTEIIILFCRRCYYETSLTLLYSDNQPSSTILPAFYKKIQGLDMYICPRCRGPASSRVLEYALMLHLLLCDNTGWIVATLWRSHAAKFFLDVPVARVLLEEESFQYVTTKLAALIAPDSSQQDQSPLIDCCLESYMAAKGGVNFTITDTCLRDSNNDK